MKRQRVETFMFKEEKKNRTLEIAESNILLALVYYLLQKFVLLYFFLIKKLTKVVSGKQQEEILWSHADMILWLLPPQVHEHLPIYTAGISEFQSRLDHLQIEQAKLTEVLASEKRYRGGGADGGDPMAA